jgi:LCCL domain
MRNQSIRAQGPTAPPRAASLLLLVLLVALAVAGCSDKKDESASTTTKGEATAKSTTTTAEGGSEQKTESSGIVDESDTPPWQRTAAPYRDDVGKTVDFECPGGGEPSPVWGTNLYTDDSSVCTAAVQVGLITFEKGGTVTIKIEAGASEYTGSTNNGVESQKYGSWGGSFSFPDADQIEVSAEIPWDRPGNYYADGRTGDITVVCPPDGTPASVWGTDTYTDDSSICTAAVHAGVITLADGGDVTFQLTPGQDSYQGSTANGVTSLDYGAWGGSLVIAPSS